REALADVIIKVSQLVSDFAEIVELDLNPVFATKKDAIAADVRIVVDFDYKPRPAPRSNEEIVAAMKRIMQPKAVAVIGASAEDGKIGNSVRKHLINGGYYTPANLCATFCTAYDVKGHAALSSQSGGIGMAIIGFSRSAKMGVSAIVGLGNKSDINEDDLLAFFEQDPNTNLIAQHCEDLKDGRAFAEAAKRVSRKK